MVHQKNLSIMKLHEIIVERNRLGAHLNDLTREYESNRKKINGQLSELERLESAAMNDLNIDYIQIAEGLLRVSGDPYGRTSDVSEFGGPTIAAAAILDIANGCCHLRKQFFGNKTYAHFYQRCDCEYGYGPSHGGIVDRISLKEEGLKLELTSDEKDACIYYLKNYKKIKELAVS